MELPFVLLFDIVVSWEVLQCFECFVVEAGMHMADSAIVDEFGRCAAFAAEHGRQAEVEVGSLLVLPDELAL
eukprot:CAMPEP_0201285138 /NCGR_PEP_ID=MMETSP1317-20130820/96037_1 /ASSEMBLY_ACC=CAM_ASM_000770 /TAXON_ID=187299 /ORGANISM="Undescribed Undescribed, Strain Undescribed" /LENGTH=71 /DNA_ID=CAMNT_0047608385 /DNA_START=72 /DNA_END=287 /DNA_ORIENTATION=+